LEWRWAAAERTPPAPARNKTQSSFDEEFFHVHCSLAGHCGARPLTLAAPALAQGISFSSGIGCCVFYVTNIDPAAPK
jgi:hypothetical protein